MRAGDGERAGGAAGNGGTVAVHAIGEIGAIELPLVCQKIGVARDRAALSAADAALYGAMYDSMSNLLNGAWDNSVEPSVVAETIVAALAAERPAARYQVGEDSKFLCDAAKKSDAEIDVIVAAFWGS